MSFVERNKLWLLPLLGLGILGVVWLNVRAFAPKTPVADAVPPGDRPSGEAQGAQAAAPSQPASAAEAPAGAQAPGSAAQPPASAAPSAPSGAAADTWADLQPLAFPDPALTRTEELLKAGQRPLGPGELAGSGEPRLHQADWARLPLARLAAPPRSAASAEPPAPGAPPPELDFLIRTGAGWSGWTGGKGYRVGQSPDGRHTLTRVHTRGVTWRGPEGTLEKPLRPDPARPLPPPTPEDK